MQIVTAISNLQLTVHAHIYKVARMIEFLNSETSIGLQAF